MTLVAVATFLGLLAIAAVLVDLVALAWAGLGGSAARRALRTTLAPYAVPAAALVAVTAMAGSLYFSDVAHLEPCTLCWYQRIAMYPLALLLVVAAIRRDAGIRRYVLALAGIGAVISAYHVAVQRLPGLPTTSCSLTSPCSAIQVQVLGFISIPVLALAAFVTIVVLMGLLDAGPALEELT